MVQQAQKRNTDVFVLISKGTYPPARHAEFTKRMADAGQVLIPAIRRLPGCLSYYAATDAASSTMVNVSFWDTLEHAQAMATLPEMGELAKEFVALGVEFERPIVNYQTLWQLP
jgi:quinol monooxygenase YgiN